MRNFWLLAAFAAFTAPSFAQNSGNAQVFSAADLHRQFAALAAGAESKGSDGTTLGDYTSHALKLSVRTKSGGAEVHDHFDDLIMVIGGSAKLVTGGTVIEAHSEKGGETTGTGIRNGKTQEISKGDIVHIPAGTPHQMIIPKGVTFSAFVVKVHE